jgi:hypothetical protein
MRSSVGEGPRHRNATLAIAPRAGRDPQNEGSRSQMLKLSLPCASPQWQTRDAPQRGGRFFYEGEGVEAGDGAVEGAADVGGDELELDESDKVRRIRLSATVRCSRRFEVGEPGPLDRRGRKILSRRRAQRLTARGLEPCHDGGPGRPSNWTTDTTSSPAATAIRP